MAKKVTDDEKRQGTTTEAELEANGTPTHMPKGEDPAEGGMFDKLAEKAQDELDEAQDRIDEAEKKRKRRTIFDEARGEEPTGGYQVIEDRLTEYPKGGEPIRVIDARITRRPKGEDYHGGRPVKAIQDEMTRRPYGENEGREPAPVEVIEDRITRRPKGEGNVGKARSIFDEARGAR